MKAPGKRDIRYLRLSVTDRCNLRCRYCLPAGTCAKLPRDDVLTFDEILLLVRLLVDEFGIARVRVTGGEPLLRRGVAGFLAGLRDAIGTREISLTTNGFLLEPVAPDLRRAGVSRLNVSLDTLDRGTFRAITGVDGLDRVLDGIRAARRLGFDAVKTNTVILPENLEETPEILAFALEHGVEARFIERMPFGAGPAPYIPVAEVKARIAARFRLVPVPPEPLDGPAVRYRVGDRGHCGFIAAMSAPFCSRCNRLRLRADGRLSPCLKESRTLDLRSLLRPEPRMDAIRRRIEHLTLEGRELREFPGRLPPLVGIGG